MKNYNVFLTNRPTTEAIVIQADKWTIKGPAEGNCIIFYQNDQDVAMFRLETILGFRVTN